MIIKSNKDLISFKLRDENYYLVFYCILIVLLTLTLVIHFTIPIFFVKVIKIIIVILFIEVITQLFKTGTFSQSHTIEYNLKSRSFIVTKRVKTECYTPKYIVCVDAITEFSFSRDDWRLGIVTLTIGDHTEHIFAERQTGELIIQALNYIKINTL